MDRLRVAALTNATGAQLAEVARVFDQYRQHYGEPAAPRQTLAWLTRCTRQGQLTIFTAVAGTGFLSIGRGFDGGCGAQGTRRTGGYGTSVSGLIPGRARLCGVQSSW